ncbi:hypothetical protein CY34DRAFT_802723 [Suillus luteus UH-Slu-Lm8-n1]|uniref:Uncharacterized protein n=1 Tax=Suillus luteus UH-Slu-Lm8-n1 TaxID=930992 RepID=A0A0D0ARS3_9AGAM|nr:hypothetical protein CY34DRAFT_802723 [Suillus luteus UH-Slu-Lm8-n1]
MPSSEPTNIWAAPTRACRAFDFLQHELSPYAYMSRCTSSRSSQKLMQINFDTSTFPSEKCGPHASHKRIHSCVLMIVCWAMGEHNCSGDWCEGGEVEQAECRYRQR